MLCRNIGIGMAGTSAFAFLAWAAFPASAMAFQVYPETCAALTITAALALLSGPSDSRRAIAIARLCAGYPLFLHVRFVLVSAVLFLFGIWTLRHTHAPRDRVRCRHWPCRWRRSSGSSITRRASPGRPRSTAPRTRAWCGHRWCRRTVLRFIADRDWGFLPSAPMLLVALAGFVSLWRVRKDLALAIAGVALALTATAATHNVAAGGGTPTALITGMAPLLIVPAAAAFREWGDRSALRMLFVVLGLLALDQAWGDPTTRT